MPKIEEGVKLDFKDVLLRPKRSTLKSRAQVSLMKHLKDVMTKIQIQTGRLET